MIGMFCPPWTFFFYCTAAYPDLPSFPTRRSSDLDWGAFPIRQPEVPRCGVRRPRRRPVRQWSCPADGERSEEHTSELQSRQYLVCPLLLEKKKRCNGRPTRSTVQMSTSARASYSV